MSEAPSPYPAAYIRASTPADVEPVVALSLQAWEPVFDSFRKILGPVIFDLQYPDWVAGQAAGVREACTSEDVSTFVIEDGGTCAGFVAVGTLDGDPPMGEIDMIAVDPRFARRGHGEALLTFAVDLLRQRGFDLATIFTGGDPGHAPARALYEAAGFTSLPTARYYLALNA